MFYYFHYYRLFEMGFQEQLQEVLNRLPSERQTLLFSATLPKVLVEFVKAGVEDPVLIRLDVDLQISENLKVRLFIYIYFFVLEFILMFRF